MDKNAIKKYATWARREMISRVAQRAAYYDITEDRPGKPGVDHVAGRVLSAAEQKQRDALIGQIQKDGYQQVVEEVAYTWFNRFCALRYMEVNNYLPSHVRVFTDDTGAFNPQILTEAIHLELDGLDMEKVYALKTANDLEQLYRYLLITQCNALNSILPGMFQKIEHYTELLLPENLLREGSVVEQLVTAIPEEDWTDQVQIIGWLYQYYNAEKKDEVFAALKKNVKITKENIPAATQLFTPDWIVRYMVENSLGRLWVEGHPNDELKSNWRYYLDEADQEPEVQAQLAQIRKEYAALNPQNIRCIDPCMGSGHILVYLFDVLVQIYETYGYSTRDAARSIVEHNLYGLDIDDRASQLAYFSVMMKARSYDRRFFSRGIAPKVYAIRESNNVYGESLAYFIHDDPTLQAAMDSILEDLHDAKEYGSILTVRPVDFQALYTRFDEIHDDFVSFDRQYCLEQLLPLVQVAEVLAQKYQVVVTNPPYMGSGNMSANLSDFVKKHYPDSKSDMFAVFMERADSFVESNGFTSLITMESWMFLSSFEKLRYKVNATKTIINMVHMPYLGKGGTSLGINFGTAAVIMKKGYVPDYNAQYEYTVYYECDENGVPFEFPTKNERWKTAKQSNFSKIPGAPVAYWVSEAIYNAFEKSESLESLATPKKGLATTDNARFLRMWHEIESIKMSVGYKSSATALSSGGKWFPLNKGGDFRRWYGNKLYLINWFNDGKEMKDAVIARYNGGSYTKEIRSENKYFIDSITWSALTAGKSSFRFSDYGALFDSAGSSMFPLKYRYYILGLLNTKITAEILAIINPTLNYGAGSVANIPVVIRDDKIACVENIAQDCVSISKADWDSFETSWDFKRHPLIAVIPKNRMLFDDVNDIDLAECYLCWEAECAQRFEKLKANEEELNRIFIDIYGLQNELTPEVADKDVTVRLADRTRDVKSLISYAVGCMFGRYSLNVDGLVYAGGSFDQKYCRWIRQFGAEADQYIDENGFLRKGGWAGASMWDYDGVRKDGHWVKATYPPDTDGIIPICDDEYFHDDIVGRFEDFIRAVYGEDSLEENLKFIADSLGGSGQPRDVIRNYFLNDFFQDHCKIYQKRPIYWQFDSGKRNGFKCLIYMHRYRPDTIARIRTDYVHEQQARYRTALADLEHRIEGAATAERVKLNKQLAKLQAQVDELRVYEEKIHHMADQMIEIDLDDGVKTNYAKFQDVLAKIK